MEMKTRVGQNLRHFLTLKDYSKKEIENLIELATKIKKSRRMYRNLLQGKSIALLFEKPSTRTRLSFETGIYQLGGNCIYLDAESLQLKRGETMEDTARVFSRYLDGVVIRTFEQERVELLARNSTIPVINGLTDLYHPCQALSDLFTLYELGLLRKDIKFTYVGDCNNVLNSLLIGFSKLGLDISVGCPEKYRPIKEVLDYVLELSKKTGSNIKIYSDPVEAVRDADVVYTDVWISMGEKRMEEKISELRKFQVNDWLLSYARENVKVMHCLPAHREEEITSDVLDSEKSIVWQQAENRLHAQKALFVYLYTL